MKATTAITSMQNVTAKKELFALTGVRGFAAFAVLMSHLNQSIATLFSGAQVYKILHAQLYVDLFFILSGFVISYVYIEKATWTATFFKKFYSARFARVYPLFFVTLLIAFLSTSGNSLLNGKLGNLITTDYIKQIFLLQAIPLVFANKIWVFTSWSVSIEWWLYILVFPVLCALGKYRSVLSSPYIITLISIALTIYMFQLAEGTSVTKSWPAWLRGVGGFFIGWLIHYIYDKKTDLFKWCSIHCDMISIVAVVIVAVSAFFPIDQPWLLLILFPYLILGLSGNESISADWMSRKTMVFLGDISYSMYLIHPILLKYSNKVLLPFFTAHNNILFIVVYALAVIGLTIFVSTMSYRYLEVPARKWLYKKLTSEEKILVTHTENT